MTLFEEGFQRTVQKYFTWQEAQPKPFHSEALRQAAAAALKDREWVTAALSRNLNPFLVLVPRSEHENPAWGLDRDILALADVIARPCPRFTSRISDAMLLLRPHWRYTLGGTHTTGWAQIVTQSQIYYSQPDPPARDGKAISGEQLIARGLCACALKAWATDDE